MGIDTADFDPFLAERERQLRASRATPSGSIGVDLRARRRSGRTAAGDDDVPTSYVADVGARRRSGLVLQHRPGAAPGQRPGVHRQLQLHALSRGARPIPGLQTPDDQQNLGFSTSFSPTPFWALSWSYPVQHHRQRVRVPRRAAGARPARVAGGVQLRAERERELRLLLSRST